MNVLKVIFKNNLVLYKIYFKKLLKDNSDKYHFLLSTDENNALKVRKLSITNSMFEKLVRFKIDSELYFENHVKS